MAQFNYDKLFAQGIPNTTRTVTLRTKYDFGTAYPDPDTLPLEGLWQGLRSALEREGRELAVYPHPQGHPGLREFVAEKLERDRGIKCKPDDIILGNGSGHMISLLLNVLLDPGDVVLTEDWFYVGTLSQLRRFRAEMVGVPVDKEGMRTDALEEKIKELRNRGKKIKLIYTISAYQNPQGMNLSAVRRKKMVEISHRYGIPVMEDECYVDLRYEGDTPTAMRGMDDSGNVLYVGSFSKIIGPGVRMGYTVAPEEVLKRMLAIKLDGGANQLAAIAILDYSRKHLDDHIDEANAALKAKRDAMLSALGENFPPTCSWSKPQGSLYVWLKLPEGADAAAMQEKAMQAGVRYIPGNLFSPTNDGKNYIRLCYGYNRPDEVKEGIAILARVFEKEGAI